MMGYTKIDFRYRRASQLDDITDLVEMLFPGNRNQQHAAACILLELRTSQEPMASLSHLADWVDVWRRDARLAQLTKAHPEWIIGRAAVACWQ